MKPLHSVRFGCSVAVASVVLYVLCVLFMAIFSRDSVILIFNSMMHGLDVTYLIRDTVPFSQFIIGIISTFAVSWVFGFIIAFCYNHCPFHKDSSK